MKIDLHKIGQVPVSFSEDISLSADSLDSDLVAGTMKVHIQGRVMEMGENHFLEASFEASGELLCTRCLAHVPWEGTGSFSIEIRPPLVGAEDQEIELDSGEMDVIFVEGSELHLERLAAEQLILEIPMRVLCSPDCAGLCARCGENKNIAGACRCETETDPRWEALRRLGESLPENRKPE